MLQSAGAIDVYFEDQIEILVADAEAVPTEAVAGVLRDAEIEYSKIVTRTN